MKRVIINETSNHFAGQIGTIIGKNSIDQYKIQLDNGRILSVEWFYFDEYIEEIKTKPRKRHPRKTYVQEISTSLHCLKGLFEDNNISNNNYELYLEYEQTFNEYKNNLKKTSLDDLYILSEKADNLRIKVSRGL